MPVNLAICDECAPPAVIGMNIGYGYASHKVGDAVHHAKIVAVPDSTDDLQRPGEAVQVYLDRIGNKYKDQFLSGALTIKSHQGPSIEVGAGLGDVLMMLHHTDAYTSLEKLGPNERRLIVVLSHNPHTVELFRWHPKAAQLDVLYVGWRAPWGTKERRRMYLPEPLAFTGGPTQPTITYYPSPEDREPLSTLGKMKYIALALTGSDNGHRDIPLTLANQAVDVAIKMGFEVVLLGRNYKTVMNDESGNPMFGVHNEPQLAPRRGLTSMVDRLTVPGTCRALQMAEAVFCSHSALCLASWFMRRPTFVVYNDAQAQLFQGALGLAFGRDYRENRHQKYSEFKMNYLIEWLDRVKSGDYGLGGAR